MASLSVLVPLLPGSLPHHQFHAKDVQSLPFRIFFAHINAALQAKERRGGGGGNAVLTRRFRRFTRFFPFDGPEYLAEVLLILCAPVCARSSRFRKSAHHPEPHSNAARNTEEWDDLRIPVKRFEVLL
jgi:hypothetical protein